MEQSVDRWFGLVLVVGAVHGFFMYSTCTASAGKNRKNAKNKDSKHGSSIGPSTLKAPIRSPEAGSLFFGLFLLEAE